MQFTLICKGTLDEIAAIVETMQTEEARVIASQEVDRMAVSDDPIEIVPAELMHRALTRRPLTQNTRKMLKVLYEADDHEEYVPRSKLWRKIGLKNDTQLNGVLGKFGMRVKRTPGYDGTSDYFEYKKLDQTGEWCYRLPDELRDVVREVLEENIL